MAKKVQVKDMMDESVVDGKKAMESKAKAAMEDIIKIVGEKFGENGGVISLVLDPDNGGRHQIIHGASIVDVAGAAFQLLEFVRENGGQKVLDVFESLTERLGLSREEAGILIQKSGPKGLQALEKLMRQKENT